MLDIVEQHGKLLSKTKAKNFVPSHVLCMAYKLKLVKIS